MKEGKERGRRGGGREEREKEREERGKEGEEEGGGRGRRGRGGRKEKEETESYQNKTTTPNTNTKPQHQTPKQNKMENLGFDPSTSQKFPPPAEIGLRQRLRRANPQKPPPIPLTKRNCRAELEPTGSVLARRSAHDGPVRWPATTYFSTTSSQRSR